LKTQRGLGDITQVDPATGDTVVAGDPSGKRLSAPLVGSAHAPAGEPERGDMIGRFIVLGVLGSGGMGVVYSAYDPHLDRKVAIKLLASVEGRSAHDAQVRLLREAQAMARINHPNVIKVHEVGTHHDRIYLAMEFADAGTLRGWLAAAKRTQREILDVFIRAGRGLAAAHAAGLVHRDFKPDNVLMSQDGAIRVTDFGLVSVADASPQVRDTPVPAVAVSLDGSLSESTPLSQDLTRTGSVMGTPIYMAPEQFNSQPTSAQTDQFAFCVALYEALYADRPFEGESYPALMFNVCNGSVLPPPASSSVPTWLRRVVLRGLAIEPSKRHATMDDLLAALADDPVRRRRRMLAFGVAGVVVASGIATAIALRPGSEAVCGSGDDRVAAVWNAATRDKIATAFRAASRPHATATLAHLGPIVDTWMDSWKAGYAEACRSTRVRGEQSEHLLDLRMQCLTRKLDDATGTLELLAAGGGDAVDHALDAVLALPSVAPCADGAGLSAAVPPPETAALQEAVAAVNKQLDAARAQRKLGRYAPGLATAQRALTAARATNYGPAIAAALTVVGGLQSDLADPAAATTLGEATRVAAAAGDTAQMIDALAWRTFELTQRDRFELAQELGDVADATAQHAHPPPEIAVRLGNTLGFLASKRGRVKDSEARYERALALSLHELGPEHPSTQTTQNQLGNLYKQEGRFADARRMLEQMLAVRERLVGKDHPDVASALNNLGNVYRVENKLADAKRLYDRALAIRLAALGPAHPEVGTSYNNLGTFYSESGDEVTAQTYFEKALANWEQAFGKDSVQLAGPLMNLAGSLNQRGDHAGARAAYERARTLLEAAHGPDHPEVAVVLSNLGVLADDEHKYDEALALYQRAQHIAEKAYGPEHPDVADYMANITSVLKTMGKLREAEEMTTRTLSVIAKAYGPDHARMGGALINYGNLQLARKEYAAARDTYTKALGIFEAKLGKDHPYVAYAAHGIASALVELHHSAEAVPFEERALAIRLATKQPPDQVGEARFGLATALAANPKTRARAIAEAKTALAEYEAGKDERNAAEVRYWLRKH
jgi:eukaryotic-like serine/threonine-protein kinase